MTQDAGLKISEQGAWLEVRIGKADAPKTLRLKLIPADFEELNKINSKIVEIGGMAKGKGAGKENDLFGREVVGLIAPHVVDWNLHDDAGKVELTDENKRKQLGRLMTAFVIDDKEQGDAPTDGQAERKPENRATALSMIMAFIGDYSNFLEA